MKGLLYSSAFPSVETLSWNWDIGHNSLLKPAISVQDLFSQPLKALLVFKLFLKHQLKHMGKGSWEKMVHFLHSCSAERRLHGKASHLGRVLLGARAFLPQERSLQLSSQAECHIAYILLILFLTSILLWHLSKSRTVSTFIFLFLLFPSQG